MFKNWGGFWPISDVDMWEYSGFPPMNFFLNQYNKPGLLQTGVNTHPNWTQKLGFHFSGLSQCEWNVNQVHHMIQFWSTTWSSPSAPNGFYGWMDYSFVVFGLSSLFKPWIGRKRPWTWLHLLLNNYWNKKKWIFLSSRLSLFQLFFKSNISGWLLADSQKGL